MPLSFSGWLLRKWSTPAAKKLRRNKLAWVGLAIVTIVVACAIFADWIAPYDPVERVGERLLPPSRKFLLGTDDFGRDIFSRIIYGTRWGLLMGLSLVGFQAAIGVPLGLIAGYYGGKIDSAIMRVADALIAFPDLVFAVAVAGLIKPGIDTIIIALGIIGWPVYARVTRGQVLSVKASDYVEAARAFGEKDRSIIIKYVFPNSLAPIIVMVTIGLPAAILVTAALSFLGLGFPLHVPEWGVMLSAARSYLSSNWWWATSVGVAIMITVLGFNFFGDGLRDALDPRLKY